MREGRSVWLVAIAAVLLTSALWAPPAAAHMQDQAAFRRALLSHHMVITAEWPDPREPSVIKRSSGTLSIVAKTEDARGAYVYAITNFHVGAPDFKSLPANVQFFVGILVVDEQVIARRFMFPTRLVAVDPAWDRMLFQVAIPKNPADLGEAFLKRLAHDEFPLTYNYDVIMRAVVPAQFASLSRPPERGTQLWLAGFAGGRAPRIVELAMNFEDLPGRYSFNFAEFTLPRMWVMDVISPPVGGMSGGFVYANSGEAVALFHGHFAVQNVAILVATTPAPDVKAWIAAQLASLGVTLP